MKKSDSWCSLVMAESGNMVSGGAARNVRIKASGGMDTILLEVAQHAAREALDRADRAVRNKRPRLKLVA